VSTSSAFLCSTALKRVCARLQLKLLPVLNHEVLGKDFMYIDFTYKKQELAHILSIQKLWMKSADIMPITTTITAAKPKPPQPIVMTCESGAETLLVIDMCGPTF